MPPAVALKELSNAVWHFYGTSSAARGSLRNSETDKVQEKQEVIGVGFVLTKRTWNKMEGE